MRGGASFIMAPAKIIGGKPSIRENHNVTGKTTQAHSFSACFGRWTLKTLAALCCLGMLASAANAGVSMFQVGSTAGNAGDVVMIPLDFTDGGDNTANFNVEILYDSANLTPDLSMCDTAPVGTSMLGCFDSAGLITVVLSGNSMAIPTSTLGQIAFTINANAPPGNYPLGIGNANFTDTSMMPTLAMANPGAIDVIVGTGPVFSSSPQPGNTIDFGTVSVGDNQVRTIVVANLGDSDLTLSNANFTQSGDSLQLVTAFPITIPGGSGTRGSNSLNVNVSCSNSQVDTDSAQLTFSTNDPANPMATYDFDCQVIEQSGGLVIIPTNGEDQTANIGEALPAPLQVQVFLGGLPLVGEPLTWSVVSGDATFASTGTDTLNNSSGSQGRSQARVQLGNTPGDIVIEVSGGNSNTVTFNATAVDPNGGGGNGTIIGNPVSGDGQSGMSGDTTDPLVANFTNDDGTPLSGIPVTWEVVGGDGMLGMTMTTTDSSGSTSNTVTYGDMAGEIVVTATPQGGDPVTFTLTNTGTGQSLVLTIDPVSDASPVTGTSGPFTACLSDADGHAIANTTLNWSITQGDATVPSQTMTGGAGCSMNSVSLGANSGIVVLNVSAGGAMPVEAIINAFAPAVSPVSGDGQEGLPGETLMPFVIQIAQPGAQKVLGGVNVSWTILEGDGSLNSATTSTGGAGRSSNVYTLGPSTGTNRIRASVPGMGSFDFTVLAKQGVDDSGSLSIVSGNGQILATNILSAPMVIELRDSDGALVPGAQINWSISPGDQFSTVTDAVTFTDANGRSSNTATVVLPDTYTVFATVDGTNLTAQFSLNSSVSNADGLTDIQASVGLAIDNACPTLASMDGLTDGQSDLLGRCTELVVNSGIAAGDVGSALNAMATEEATAQGNRAVRTAETQINNLKGRLLALRSGAKVQAFQGLTFTTPDGSIPASAIAALLADDSSGSGDDPGFSRLGFFITGAITSGDRDDTANEVGFDFDTYGLTAGVDYRFTDQFVFGGAIGYNNTDSDLSDGLSTLDADGYSLSAYGSYYTEESFYVDGILTWGDNDYESRRAINYAIATADGTGITNVSQMAIGTPGGDSLSFTFSAGKDFQRDNMTWTPYARVSWADLDIDAYSERAADLNAPGMGLGLQVDSQNIESLLGTIGGQVSWAVSQDWGVLLPTITVEYEHEFDDDPRTVSARFLNDPTNTNFFVLTDEPDRNYFNVGFGLSAILTGGKTAYIFYEGVFGLSEIDQHSISAGMRFEF